MAHADKKLIRVGYVEYESHPTIWRISLLSGSFSIIVGAFHQIGLS